jgi:hypothetical protein
METMQRSANYTHFYSTTVGTEHPVLTVVSPFLYPCYSIRALATGSRIPTPLDFMLFKKERKKVLRVYKS